jgi:hypothetical protein
VYRLLVGSMTNSCQRALNIKNCNRLIGELTCISGTVMEFDYDRWKFCKFYHSMIYDSLNFMEKHFTTLQWSTSYLQHFRIWE